MPILQLAGRCTSAGATGWHWSPHAERRAAAMV